LAYFSQKATNPLSPRLAQSLLKILTTVLLPSASSMWLLDGGGLVGSGAPHTSYSLPISTKSPNAGAAFLNDHVKALCGGGWGSPVIIELGASQEGGLLVVEKGAPKGAYNSAGILASVKLGFDASGQRGFLLAFSVASGAVTDSMRQGLSALLHEIGGLFKCGEGDEIVQPSPTAVHPQIKKFPSVNPLKTSSKTSSAAAAAFDPLSLFAMAALEERGKTSANSTTVTTVPSENKSISSPDLVSETGGGLKRERSSLLHLSEAAGGDCGLKKGESGSGLFSSPSKSSLNLLASLPSSSIKQADLGSVSFALDFLANALGGPDSKVPSKHQPTLSSRGTNVQQPPPPQFATLTSPSLATANQSLLPPSSSYTHLGENSARNDGAGAGEGVNLGKSTVSLVAAAGVLNGSEDLRRLWQDGKKGEEGAGIKRKFPGEEEEEEEEEEEVEDDEEDDELAGDDEEEKHGDDDGVRGKTLQSPDDEEGEGVEEDDDDDDLKDEKEGMSLRKRIKRHRRWGDEATEDEDDEFPGSARRTPTRTSRLAASSSRKEQSGWSRRRGLGSGTGVPHSLHPSEHGAMTASGLPAVSMQALTRVKGRSKAAVPKLAVALRRGKWVAEEEVFTSAIVDSFRAGLLPLEEGTTLRTFLSGQLREFFFFFRHSRELSAHDGAQWLISPLHFFTREIYPPPPPPPPSP